MKNLYAVWKKYAIWVLIFAFPGIFYLSYIGVQSYDLKKEYESYHYPLGLFDIAGYRVALKEADWPATPAKYLRKKLSHGYLIKDVVEILPDKKITITRYFDDEIIASASADLRIKGGVVNFENITNRSIFQSSPIEVKEADKYIVIGNSFFYRTNEYD